MTKPSIIAFATLAACGGGNSSLPDPGGDFVVEGSNTASASGTTFVLWLGDNGKGDFVFKHGEGAASGTAFNIGIDEPLPADASFGDTFGLGQVGLFDTSFVLADGIVADESGLENAALGFAGEFAVIYIGTQPAQLPEWTAAFPAGLSCGKCVHAQTGFDSYAPVACGEMQLQVGGFDTLTVCNAN